MGFIKEFKKFISKGNVIDLAVGIVIGTAFGNIVSSLVADIFMPPLGLLIGEVDFKHLKIPLTPKASINIGNFIQNIFTFLVIALAVFIFLKILHKFYKEEEKKAPPAPNPQEKLLEEIRDILKKQAKS